MKTVIIDDEQPALDELTYYLQRHGAEVIGGFTSPREGLSYIMRESPDAVFLDIDMPEMNGIELGVKIQELVPGVTIVFVTAYPQYALEAYRAHPLDYIIKPIEEERFSQTMQYIARNIELRDRETEIPARITCFGSFNVAGSEPARFVSQKAKELLAYLLCHAEGKIYRDELTEALFGARDPKKALNYLHVTLYRLRSTLMTCKIGKNDLFICEDYSLEIRDGICDYIDFCRFLERNRTIDEGNVQQAEAIIGLYRGELFDDIDAHWAEDKRQWAAVRFEELLIRTAACRLSEGNTKAAEGLLTHLLECNPFSDQGYTLLLDLYIENGDKVRYELCFRQYRKTMIELHEPVGGKYLRYYKKLTQSLSRTEQ